VGNDGQLKLGSFCNFDGAVCCSGRRRRFLAQRASGAAFVAERRGYPAVLVDNSQSDSDLYAAVTRVRNEAGSPLHSPLSLNWLIFRGLPDAHHTPKYRKNGNVNPIAKAAAAWTM
jgi:hypothetical protein